MKYTITQSRLLYILKIDDKKHSNLLKIGEVFVDNDVADSQDKQELSKAVRNILDKRSYMQGVTYHIEYVECTTYNQQTSCYKADDVYRTLVKMGTPCLALNKLDKNDADFWFKCSIKEVEEAVKKIKAGQGAGFGAIKFRPEQDRAIKETVAHFRKSNGKAFLWNAKMRFGKTLSGLEVARQMDYKSTLIITHRPVVDKGWHDDFKKIFGNRSEYVYATRMSDEDSTGGDFFQLEKEVDDGKKRLVFFVSMQYLRLSQFVGGKERNFDPLKKAIMEYDWDFVMVDEAHEGIEAAAGVRVMEKLKKENTRILSLSGTPFNLLDKYEEGEIYTWDYVMEQRAKQEWDDKHFGDPNPYADLPRMQILTFTLPKMVREEAIKDNEVFKFHEFFRVWTKDDERDLQKLIDGETDTLKLTELQAKKAEIKIGKFVHENAVRKFVEKLRTKSETSQYPFSNEEFRDKFRHTFWLLPGVDEAKAMEEILKNDRIFGGKLGFHIINAAGDGNIEDVGGNALAEVEDNIRGYDPAKDSDKERAKKKKPVSARERTITLSCGKLTTGVSVPEWTAVLCMKGSENTPAANYMQTIFRVQTHAVLKGRQKSDCYVFDFAPDRALTAVAETAKMAVDAQGAGKKQMKRKQKEEEQHLEAFIKLCPVLSMDEGEMGKRFSANQIFEKLSNVYIERAVRSGYADNSIYNPDQLLNLNPEQEKALGDVRDLLGSMPSGWKPEKININKNGLGDVEHAEQIKYIYYLSAQKDIPARPTKAAENDGDGRPISNTPGWDDSMCAPSQRSPYLFVSNSRFVEGSWTDFSKPVLWKEWKDIDKDTEKAKKERDAENKEKRARMSVLRGVAIRIPLLVYGAEINDDDGEEITIDNFASEEIVDQASWEEFMPKGFTKETFNILKDCFDRSIFTGAAKRIRQMVKEADILNTEDRIAKIATIFSYFHNPDKETVLTPWKVVNRHMSDCLGGWCFFNEEFDAEYTEENDYGENIRTARFVDRGDVTRDIFYDNCSRILEINSKTGLYPLYMAYSIFRCCKEPLYREYEQTRVRGNNIDAAGYERQARDDLEIWKDVLQDNIFVVCRTKMAVSITKRTLAGFRNDIRMNVKCYGKNVAVNDLVDAGVIKNNGENTTRKNGMREIACDMITVLRAKPELFREDVVQGINYWHVYNTIPRNENEDLNNMKFKAIVGNPPYQFNVTTENNVTNAAYSISIYNLFIEMARQLEPIYLSMITPSRWMSKAGQSIPDEWVDEMINCNHFRTIHDYLDATDCFTGVEIKGGINYFLYQNSYIGPCKHYIHNNQDVVCKDDYLNRRQLGVVLRDPQAGEIIDKVIAIEGSYFEHDSFANLVGARDFFTTPKHLTSNWTGYSLHPDARHDIKYYLNKRLVSDGFAWIRKEDIPKGHDAIPLHKVFFPKAGGSGNDPYVIGRPFYGEPNSVSADTYMIIGYDPENHHFTKAQCLNIISYMKTKFFRYLVSVKKKTQLNARDVFQFVPMQDFNRAWTDEDLYEKYGLNNEERSYINALLKTLE